MIPFRRLTADRLIIGPFRRGGDAVIAGMPWLDVFCPGCRTGRAIIRAIDRHPLASVGSLVLGLRWSWCQAAILEQMIQK